MQSMHPKKILAIFRKDLRDAIRDARILSALLVPIGIGLLYSFIFDDSESRPEATVVVVSPDASGLPDALRTIVGDTIDLQFTEAADADHARRLVDEEDADIGVVLPSGFDNAVRQGDRPSMTVLLPDSPGFGGNYVAASLDDTARMLAGQQPPATIQVERVAPAEDDTADFFDELGLRRWMTLLSVILLVGMVSIFAVPVILTEESEKRTLEALTVIASYADVVAAKALVGLAYLVITVPLLLLVTRMFPENSIVFASGILLFSVAMIGFGLLLGGICRTTSQVNTWSGIVLMLVIFPSVLFALPLPAAAEMTLAALPTSQVMRLASNAVSGVALFENSWLAYPVIAAWGIAAYIVLLWRLARREA